MLMTETRPDTGRMMSAGQAAEYVGVKVQTLAAWRCSRRTGPAFLKVGRLVKYRVVDLDDWLESRRFASPDDTE